jgi:TolB-like protein/Tfp pilus assembly protein PilF
LASERIERRLAAIMMADVANYSRLMGADEEDTLARLRAHQRELIDPVITQHGGRLVKTTGDGILVEFASAVDCLRCAVVIQRGMAERNATLAPGTRITFRIGINVGDIMVDGGDIFGDGVNVAARLEAIAEPGGICVSGRVHEDVRGRLDIALEDGGEQQLKNIAWPVRVWHVRPGPAGASPAPPTPSDKPSIAVLPFQNMSGDAEQEYFADGVVEEIITALSRMRWLLVIARNSSFTYKGRAVDMKQVGRELGARYVLEGSVRKAANRVRITGQLIDTMTGAHLWADRFEGSLDSLFELQDQVTESVVGAIAPNLERAEIERAKRKPTASLDAYDYYLRGMAGIYRWTREAHEEALQLFHRAIALDPEFAAAHAMAARCYAWRKTHGWMIDVAAETAECVRLARRATQLGRADAVALTQAGFALARVAGDLDSAAALIDRALALNPNLAAAWMSSGYVRVWLGEPEVAVEHFMRAIRLSSLDPQMVNIFTGIASAHFSAGRDDEASAWTAKAEAEHGTFAPAARIAAAVHAFAGRREQAQAAVARLLEVAPGARVSSIDVPYRRPEDRARLQEGLRKAGLPE